MSTDIVYATVYVTEPQGYRYKGRHRRPLTLKRAAAGLVLSAIWLGFATVGVISAVLPR